MEVVVDSGAWRNGSVLSARLGEMRRLAALQPGGAQLRFPRMPTSAEEMQVDLYARVAAKKFMVGPAAETCNLEVNHEGFTNVKLIVAPTPAGGTVRSATPGAFGDWPETSCPSGGDDNSDRARIRRQAQEYVDRFDLRRLLTELFQRCVKERPEDPVEFMRCALEAKAQARNGEPFRIVAAQGASSVSAAPAAEAANNAAQTAEIERLSARVRELEQACAADAKRARELLDEVASSVAAAKEAGRLREELDRTKQEASDAKAAAQELAQLKQEEASLREELVRAEQQVAANAARGRSAAEDVSKLREELVRSKQEAAQGTAEIGETANLRKELDHAKHEVEAVVRKHAELEASLANARADALAAQAARLALEKQVAAKASEIDQLRSRLKQMDEQQAAHQQQMESWEQIHRESEASLKSSTAGETAKLREELHHSKQEVDALHQKHQNLETSLSSARAEALDAAEGRLESERQMAAKAVEIDQLSAQHRQELDAQQAVIRDLKERLHQQEQEHALARGVGSPMSTRSQWKEGKLHPAEPATWSASTMIPSMSASSLHTAATTTNGPSFMGYNFPGRGAAGEVNTHMLSNLLASSYAPPVAPTTYYEKREDVDEDTDGASLSNPELLVDVVDCLDKTTNGTYGWVGDCNRRPLYRLIGPEPRYLYYANVDPTWAGWWIANEKGSEEFIEWFREPSDALLPVLCKKGELGSRVVATTVSREVVSKIATISSPQEKGTMRQKLMEGFGAAFTRLDGSQRGLMSKTSPVVGIAHTLEAQQRAIQLLHSTLATETQRREAAEAHASTMEEAFQTLQLRIQATLPGGTSVSKMSEAG